MRPALTRAQISENGQAAIGSGDTRYTGSLCWRHPHLEGERQTRSGGCVECRRERKLFVNLPPEQIEAQRARGRVENMTPA
jgi:hypothetical protein